MPEAFEGKETVRARQPVVHVYADLVKLYRRHRLYERTDFSVAGLADDYPKVDFGRGASSPVHF